MELRENVSTRVNSRSNASGQSKSYRFIKRLIDIIVSFTLLLLFSPLLVFICWRIQKKEGKTILYREMCVGKDRYTFVLWRFRTMTNPSRVIYALPPHPFPASWKSGVPDQFTIQRDSGITITPTGLWLRKYHFHKLPQLWNVIKGDMSLVGPKPEIREIADYYNEHQLKRLAVKPGIIAYTGLYDNQSINHNEKVNLDLYYIKKRSFKMDVRILCHVVVKRLRLK